MYTRGVDAAQTEADAPAIIIRVRSGIVLKKRAVISFANDWAIICGTKISTAMAIMLAG